MIKSKQIESTLRSQTDPFDAVYSDNFVGDINGAIKFTALNNTNAVIPAYSVVCIDGVSGNTPTVALANSTTTAMPAFGITTSASSHEDNVDVITFGNLKGVDTSSFSAGASLYVSSTSGQYTDTPPTGSSTKLQNIGTVIKSHSNGIIKVGGAGRSALTPNLDDGKFFIGTSNNQASQSSYTLPFSDGTSGQVLTTDGAGALSFVTPTVVTTPDASETVKGVLEVATDLEASAGTAADKALVPSNVSSLSIASNQITGLATVATSAAYSDISGTPDLSTYAPIDSPEFTGVPIAVTASEGTNTTQIATTAFVTTALTGSSEVKPTLAIQSNTSYTIAAADAPNLYLWYGLENTNTFTVTLPSVTDILTGTGSSTNGDPEETFALFVGRGYEGDITFSSSDGIDGLGGNDISPYVSTFTVAAGTWIKVLGFKSSGGTGRYLIERSPYGDFAPIASPGFTGVPTAVTAAAGTNTTQLATTAFVTTAVSASSGSLDIVQDQTPELGGDLSMNGHGFSTDILPTSSLRTLGDSSIQWGGLYLKENGKIYFGSDQDVELIHDPNDGLILDLGVFDSSHDPMFMLRSQSSSSIGPKFKFLMQSAYPNTNDIVGQVDFSGWDTGGGEHQYGIIRGRIGSPTAGAETGKISILTYPASANNRGLHIESDSSGQSKVNIDHNTGYGLHLNNVLVTSKATELNLLDGDASVGQSVTISDNDGFILNDNGTTKLIPASDLKTYAGSSLVNDQTPELGGDLSMGAFGIADDLLPSTPNAHALGSPDAEWSDLYLSDGAVINFGADQDIKLSHTPDQGLTLSKSPGGAFYPRFTLQNQDSGALSYAEFKFESQSTTPAVGDFISRILSTGKNSVSGNFDYTKIETRIANPTDSTEAGRLLLRVGTGGTTAGNSGTDAIDCYGTTTGEIIVKIPEHDGTSSGLMLDNTLVTSTAAELNLLDGGSSIGASVTIADTDGLILNDNGVSKLIPASDLKTYAGGGGGSSLPSITTLSGNASETLGTASGNEEIYLLNQADVDVYMVAASSVDEGFKYHFKYMANGGYYSLPATINVNASSSDTIDDGTSTSIDVPHRYDSITLVSDGTSQWYVI